MKLSYIGNLLNTSISLGCQQFLQILTHFVSFWILALLFGIDTLLQGSDSFN